MVDRYNEFIGFEFLDPKKRLSEGGFAEELLEEPSNVMKKIGRR